MISVSEESSTAKTQKPVALFMPIHTAEGILFRTPWKSWRIEDHCDLVWRLLECSDGTSSIQSVCQRVSKELLNTTVAEAEAALLDLRDLGIVDFGNSFVQRFHEASKNPLPEILGNGANAPMGGHPGERLASGTILHPRSSVLSSVLRDRRSHRNFGARSVGRGDLADVIATAFEYGESGNTVPSAGGFFPISLDVVVQRAGVSLPVGYFKYDPQRRSLGVSSTRIDEIALTHAFNSPNGVYGAPIALVISASFALTVAKYGSRGYRYVLLEAGQLAQNILLTAQDAGMITCEYGGFLDDALALELGLSGESREPLIVVGLGYPSTPEGLSNCDERKEYIQSAESASSVARRIVQSGVVTSLTAFEESGPLGSLFLASAYGPPSGPNGAATVASQFLGGAADPSFDLAIGKASLEALERRTCGLMRSDVTARALDFDEWFDVRLSHPLNAVESSRMGLSQFDVGMTLEWVKGTDLQSGRATYVPVDLVFFPFDSEALGRRPVAQCTSSGVAASVTRDDALRRALLELIERDAIMRTLHRCLNPKRVHIGGYSYHWQRHAEAWARQGVRLSLYDLSQAGVSIALSTMSQGRRPYFACGAGVSIESGGEAATSAFREALRNFSLLSRIDVLPAVAAEQVHLPEDHALYFAHTDRRSSFEWLDNGEQITSMTEPTATMRDLIEAYRPVSVELPELVQGIWTIRCLSSLLVPIYFGHGQGYVGHRALKGEGQPLVEPHFFA